MPPYHFGNPINDFYIRQTQPQYQQQMLPFPPQNIIPNQTNFVTRYVSNVSEAKAAFVDPCVTYLFLDSSNGKIYLKRMEKDGTSAFIPYTPDESKEKQSPFDELNVRLNSIENILGELKNDKSVSSNADFKQSNGYVATADVAENAKAESPNVPADSKYNRWKK